MARPRKEGPLLDQIDAAGYHRLFERRADRREIVLEDEHGDPLLILDAENISLGGLFLRCHVPFRLGTHALLRFSLPDVQQPIRLVGEIVRLEREHPDAIPTGAGLRFVELSRDVQVAIRQWVSAG
jgi:uncharacterized protein (TIGR02266 family)